MESSGARYQVLQTLRALGGEGTLGDLLVLTGLSRREVETSIEGLMATGWGQVRVFDHGDLTYHLGERRRMSQGVTRGRAPGRAALTRDPDPARRRQISFDRKTLRLIRAREGVISVAELVEHSGLPVPDTEEEMGRLARAYGGEPHISLDGHVVHAFPELMTSAYSRFAGREPRPAWVRCDDPMEHPRTRRRATVGLILSASGVLVSAAAPWPLLLVLRPTTASAAAVLVSAVAGIVFFGSGFRRALGSHRLFRFRQAKTLRRYALGHVFETALRGKGVVSLERTVAFLQARAGKRKVKWSAVEKALRELAGEFGAPITKEGRGLFFGFRNIKRQFLASHIIRRRLRLGRTVVGRTVFDSADSPLCAAQRDLEAFDRALARGRPCAPETSA